MTVHRWFANKSCPGNYLYNLHGDVAQRVNSKLGKSALTSDSVSVVYRSLGVAAKREKASTKGILKGRCVKGSYYVADEVVMGDDGKQKWFRHTGTGLYSALTDTDGSRLFEFVGNCKVGKANAYVKVRSGAGVNYKVLTTLRKGDTVHTTGKEVSAGEFRWVQVIYDNRLCWCDKQWLTI